MYIKVLNETIEVTELSSLTELLVQVIGDVLEKNENLMISHLVIDDVEHSIESMEELDIADETQFIEVIMVDAKTRVMELAAGTQEYVKDAIQSVEQLASEFYKSPQSESWNKLSQLFESLELLTSMLGHFSEISIANKQEAENVLQALSSLMEELHQAMTKQDYVLMGDLLNYEVIGQLKSISEIATKIGNEVAAND